MNSGKKRDGRDVAATAASTKPYKSENPEALGDKSLDAVAGGAKIGPGTFIPK